MISFHCSVYDCLQTRGYSHRSIAVDQVHSVLIMNPFESDSRCRKMGRESNDFASNYIIGSDWSVDERLPVLNGNFINFDFDLDNFRDDFSDGKLDYFYSSELPSLTDQPTLAALNLVEDKFDKFDSSDLDRYLLDDLDKELVPSTALSCTTTSVLDSISTNNNPSTSYSSPTAIVSSVGPESFIESVPKFLKDESNLASQSLPQYNLPSTESNIYSLNESPKIKEEPGEASTSNHGSSLVDNLSPKHTSYSVHTDSDFSSYDEGFASQLDSEGEHDDDTSDDESFYKDYEAKDLIGANLSGNTENRWSLDVKKLGKRNGQSRYFWQYNVQSKGPKQSRIVCVPDSYNDPYVLTEAKDPVFSSDFKVEGVKHAGKARRGDGNDLTPSPKKLLMIGLELKKLSQVINDLTPTGRVTACNRNKARKEKNKLASRVCRLKKKANHEANKIKLFGIQQEHKRLMDFLVDIKRMATQVVEEGRFHYRKPLIDVYNEIRENKKVDLRIAENTSEFVNHVLDNVAAGIKNGGLNQL